ncbi:hypothetical protein QBC32DRAFT_211835, partial [Pseudoneurospora amorphoporcata]
FLAKFERLLYKAKVNSWSKSAKISLLRCGLNDSTRKRARLIQPISKTYNEYLRKLKEVTGFLKKDRHRFSSFKGKDKDEMDVNAIKA